MYRPFIIIYLFIFAAPSVLARPDLRKMNNECMKGRRNAWEKATQKPQARWLVSYENGCI
jgi:hypothetical protein